jgi:hypothetical protein
VIEEETRDAAHARGQPPAGSPAAGHPGASNPDAGTGA